MALVYLPCAFVGIQFGPFVETHLTINLSSSEHTCQDMSQDETIHVSILVPDVLNNKIKIGCWDSLTHLDIHAMVLSREFKDWHLQWGNRFSR